MAETTITLAGLLFYIGLLNFFPILDYPIILLLIFVMHVTGGILLFRSKKNRKIGFGLLLSAGIFIFITITLYLVAINSL